MQKMCQRERYPEIYTHNRLFYIKKKSQSDYIISSQNSRIGSCKGRNIVLQRRIMVSIFPKRPSLIWFTPQKIKARQSVVIDGLSFLLEVSRGV